MISLKNVVVSIVAIVFVATIIVAQQLESRTADAAAPSVTNPRLSEVKGSRLMQLSGALKDPAGRPLSGVVGILTSLYKDPDGGTALWSETQNVQLDAQGNYSLLLGTTTGEGIPLDILSSSEPRWLGVQALVPGSEEQPRFLLVSVPYALKAADADTLGGKPLSAFVLSDPEGKNGSASSDGRKRNSSGSTKDESPTSAITNPGTSGHFAKYVNSTDLGDAVSVEDGSGNVSSAGAFTGAAHWLNGFGSLPNANGFGMSAPNTVIFATNAQQSLKIDPSGNVTAPVGSFTGAAFWLNAFGSATNSNGLAMPAANQISLNTNAQERLRIDSGGNITFSGKLNGMSAAATSAAATRGIVYLGGCDTCSVLADADDQKTIYFNVVGPMTIQEVRCFSDVGTPSINIQRDDGSPANVLSADLQCTTSGATSTSFQLGENVLNLNDKLDFVMVTAGGAAHRVTVAIKATVN